MTRTGKRVLIGISIIITVLVLVVAIFLGVIVFSLKNIKISGHSFIEYENLTAVMQDDVVYLSDDFLEDNNLQIRSIYYGNYGKRLGNVRLDYKDKKLVNENTDFTKRVENIYSYSYELYVNNQYDEDDKPIYMPYTVSVKGIVERNKDIKFDKTTDSGYRYKIYDMQSTTEEFTQSCVIQSEEKVTILKKRYCTLEVTLKLDVNLFEVNYSKEDIQNKFDSVLVSALNNIERYY